LDFRNLRVLGALHGKVRVVADEVVMSFNAREIYANLAEKEKIKGHHSPEGQAMRTLSRALQGWLSGTLVSSDVLSMCRQAIEDWLKARLKVSAWSARELPDLLARAVAVGLLTRLEAVRLQRLHNRHARLPDEVSSITEVETMLECCIQVVEKHW
jgi:hypothetical protein